MCTSQLLVLVAIAMFPERLNTVGVRPVTEVAVVTLHDDCPVSLPSPTTHLKEGRYKMDITCIYLVTALY